MFSLFRKDESRSELLLPEALADTHDAGSRAPALQVDDATTALGCQPAEPVVPAANPTVTAASQDAAAGPNSDGDRPVEPSADALHTNAPTNDIGSERAREWDAEVAPPSDPTSRRADDEGAPQGTSDWLDDLPQPLRAGGPRPHGKRLAQPDSPGRKKRSLTPPQRLLLLDSWRRSGLPAGDFAALVGISKHTLYVWNQRFERFGPEGLLDQPRRERSGGRLPELTKRTILMLKQSHPEWGCQRISDLLQRGPALAASPSSVARVLHEAGYEVVQEPTRAHPDKVRRFERAKPNQLWQTDLFTFTLKRQNRRVHLVAFMDDHSRFIVSYGLHATASTALVLEALEAGIGSYGPPEEVLTDNGPQYVTWRGKSQFTRRLEQLGIRQIVARPRRPQTLGKIERFWGTLWREFLETAVFVDLAEARTRIGLFIDYHNFQRVHRGIDGLVPADRFFGAAKEVARTLKERVAANALELARHGEPRAPFYVTGQMDGQSFSVHAEGPRLILTRPGQSRQEVELAGPAAESKDPSPPDAQEPARQAWVLPNPVCPDGSPNPEAIDETVSSEPAADDERPGGDA